jgi:hypothetical protein
MGGHGEKFSRKKERLIASLLTKDTVGKAAKCAGVGETTAWRWMQDPQFVEKYREAKARVVEQAVSKIQRSCSKAVDVLLKIATDEKKPASARVSAACKLVDFAMRVQEAERIEARLQDLERAMGAF